MPAVRTHFQTQLSSLLPSPLPHPSPSYVETLEQPLSIRPWVTKQMSSPSCKKSGQKTMQQLDGPYPMKNWSVALASGRASNSKAQSACKPAKLIDSCHNSAPLQATTMRKATSSLRQLKYLHSEAGEPPLFSAVLGYHASECR